MKMSDKLDQLLPALAKARQQFSDIKKSKTNPHFKSKYAALDDILPAIIPALAAEGLVLIGELGREQEGVVTVTTRLMHISEQWIESAIDLSYQFGNLQKLGGEITYTRRYSINTILQLAADEDLDEQDGTSPKRRQDGTRSEASAFFAGPGTDPKAPPPAKRLQPQDVRPLGKPTADEVNDLVAFLRGAYRDEARVSRELHTVLQIPDAHDLSDFRLRKEMTRAHYTTLQDAATAYALHTSDPEDDVPDVSGPTEATAPTTDADASGEGQEPSALEGLTTGQPEGVATNLGDAYGRAITEAVETAWAQNPEGVVSAATHATIEQLDGLEALAGEMSEEAVTEVRNMRARHRNVALTVYQEVMNRLLLQKEQKAKV